MKKLWCLISLAFLSIVLSNNAYSQIDDWLDYSLDFYDNFIPDTTYRDDVFDSRYGYCLSPHGQIRFLAVFVELEYDNPADDPYLIGTDIWGVGSLPRWADSLFAVYDTSNYNSKLVTKYYRYASSNGHIVLGDFLIAPDNGGVFKIHTTDGLLKDHPEYIIDTINQKLGTNIVTASGTLTSIGDFDKWTPTQKGIVKEHVGNGNWDYVVYIIRNANSPNNPNGYTTDGDNTLLLGHKVDYYSMVCVGNKFDPTHVIRHEYAHTLLGGNNFHTCGGGWAYTYNYWIPQTGGWALLGLYNSSLMCWNAWDRYRLGWKGTGNAYDISARSSDGITEVNGDIDINNGNGIYVLRDFVTTGDALRIKLPYIDEENEYPEWIWLENHQGVSNNNVEFDQWQYQRFDCVGNYTPGLMAYIQINSNTRESNNQADIFGQFADYLNPLTANGFWDRQSLVDSVNNGCVSDARIRPFIRVDENPLTGCGDQSFYAIDLDDNDSLYSDPNKKNKQDQLNNWTEITNNDTLRHLFQLGHSSHSFNLSGNKKIGICTNPSSASLINMVGEKKQNNQAQNLRTTYLNGISIEILEQSANGNIKVQIRFDDVDIDNDVRWCSDSIVLNEIPTSSGYSLHIKPNKTITLDQGLTATRMTNPISFNGQKIFASPTTFTIQPDVRINIDTAASIVLENSSKLRYREGSECTIDSLGSIVVKSGTVFQMDDCSTLIIRGTGKLIVEDSAILRISNHAFFDFAKGTQNIQLGNNVIIPEGYANPLALLTPSIGNTQINGLTIWEGYNMVVNGIITVNSGATLRVKSSFLRFKNENSGIIVDRGGKLIIDNSTLTTLCHNSDYMWKGIEVWGNRYDHQYIVNGNYLQGYLELKNNATIENASCAVELGAPNSRVNMGGIIHATNAVFRNNALAVRVRSYTNHNPINGAETDYNGWFNNCTFTINSEYIGMETFQKHVDISYVNGIVFRGCAFAVDPNTAGVSADCMGIYANNAGFKVQSFCTDNSTIPCLDSNIKQSIFNSFHNGILSVNNGMNTYSFSVQNSKFINNHRGVFAQNTNDAIITSNEFRIGSGVDCNYGIYLDGISDFFIEDNIFYRSAFMSTDNNSYGIGIFNTENNNDIYNNTFENLTCGNIAYGVNYTTIGHHTYGLTYSCNDNTANNIDFCVLNDDNTGGINPKQGYTECPAGNTFSGSLFHFYNETYNTIDYYYNSNGTNESPDPNKVSNLLLNSTTYSNNCNTHYGDGGGGIVKSPDEKAELAKIYKSSDNIYVRYMAAADIVRSDLNDSIFNLPELREWLNNMNNITASRTAIASYIQEGDFLNAFALANTLPDVYNLTEVQLLDYNDYMKLLNLYYGLYDSNRTLNDLTDIELKTVIDIADNGFGKSKTMANIILLEIGNRDTEPYICPELPQEIRNGIPVKNINDIADDKNMKVNLNPNPATTWITIDYQLPENSSQAHIALVNSYGITVMNTDLYGGHGTKTIDLQNLANGVYTYIIKCDEFVNTGKLVITK